MKRKFQLISPITYIYLLCISIFFISCGSKQDIVYFQDVDAVGSSRPIVNYVPVIRPDDELTITVSALDIDAVRPFNLQSVSFTNQVGQAGGVALQTYLVGPDGTINFPVLGNIKLAGLNRNQVTSLITDLLKEYVKNPIVNIRIVNFKVTVLGMVNNPGSYTIQNERITILEALGLAGDMGLQAERRNVLVVREDEGKKTYYRVNMTSESVFNSPVYYLSQNDVIYVEPNNSMAKSSTVGPSTGVTLTLVGTLVTVAALIINITR